MIWVVIKYGYYHILQMEFFFKIPPYFSDYNMEIDAGKMRSGTLVEAAGKYLTILHIQI